MNHATKQPAPTGNGDPVMIEVIADMMDRRRVGKEKYGIELHTHNGRNALVDAYQEALDLALYLKQRLMEEDYGRRLPDREFLVNGHF